MDHNKPSTSLSNDNDNDDDDEIGLGLEEDDYVSIKTGRQEELSNDNDRKSTIKTYQQDQEPINDVVAYSLCILAAIELKQLYDEQYHEKFIDTNIKLMAQHFKLPDKVLLSINEFVNLCSIDQMSPQSSSSNTNQFEQQQQLAEGHVKTFVNAIKKDRSIGTFRIIEELVLFSVKFGTYDARLHHLIMRISTILGVPQELVEIYGESVFESLLKEAYELEKMNQSFRSIEKQQHTNNDNHVDNNKSSELEVDLEKAKKATRKKYKKYLLIGLASIGGGTVLGVTGGLAAPIVASAFAGVIGTAGIAIGHTAAMSTAAVGIVGSLFGVAGAGLTGTKMQKRLGDLEEFKFEKLSPNSTLTTTANNSNDISQQTSLTFTIAISGWITDDTDDNAFKRQWANLNCSKEQYCIRYESKYLCELGRAIDYLLGFVVSYATQEALKYTFLASFMAAIAWPTAMITIASVIDNPWDVCLRRSAEAGKHLAQCLLDRPQGKRPVTLIGFSLGARVIFYCLQELYELSQQENENKKQSPNQGLGPCDGLIGDVYLLGAPVTASPEQFRPFLNIVCGQLINGYCSSDWLLKFLYRTSSAAIKVAGLQPIQYHHKRLKNIDLKPIIDGHMDYYKNLDQILDYVGIKIFKNCVSTSKDLILLPLLSTSTSKSKSMSKSTSTTTTTNNDSGIQCRSQSFDNTINHYRRRSLSLPPKIISSVNNRIIINKSSIQKSRFSTTIIKRSYSDSCL